MKTLTNMVLALTLTNMVLLPVAQAQTGGAAAAARVEAFMANPAAVERAQARITANGTQILGAGYQPATLASLAVTGADDFTIITPAVKSNTRFAIRVMRDLSAEQARLTFVLMNYSANTALDLGQALDRSAITVRAGDAPEAFQVAMQRLERRFASAMGREVAARATGLEKAMSSALNAVVPSAHADIESAIRWARESLATASLIALACLVGGPVLMIGGMALTKSAVGSSGSGVGRALGGFALTAVGGLAFVLAVGLGGYAVLGWLIAVFAEEAYEPAPTAE